MRKIKFRAWDKKRKEWYGESDPYSLTFYGFHIFGECTMLCGPKTEDLEHIEITQWTGLTDKNRKEIYEGDIVIRNDYPFFDCGNPNYRASVEWVGGGMCTVLHCVNPSKCGISDGEIEPIEDGEEDELEVIGNIYENGGLLEKN